LFKNALPGLLAEHFFGFFTGIDSNWYKYANAAKFFLEFVVKFL